MQASNGANAHNFSLQYIPANSHASNPLTDNKARFYALVLSKIEMAQR